MDRFSFRAVIFSSLIIPAITAINRVVAFNYKEWHAISLLYLTNVVFFLVGWFSLIFSYRLFHSSVVAKKVFFKSKIFEFCATSIAGIFCIAVLSFPAHVISSHNNYYLTNSPMSIGRFFPILLVRSFMVIVMIQTLKYLFDLIYEKQKIVIENEMLKRESISAQLYALKQQVNPHFLFNSLNTLKSLIRTKDSNSEKFLIKLSDVYRYILQKDQNDLISIREELKVLDAYIFMLKARFEDCLDISININKNIIDNHVLPPFTMQILIENATKHNVVSHANPLHIEVFNYGEDRLVIRNNLQLKRNVEESNGIGLVNIDKRCRYYCGRGIEIIKTDREFTVEVPVIIQKRAVVDENSDY